MLGNGLATIAITFAVLDLTGSATDLGIVLAARSIPQVVFLLFGGVLADRLPRHLVLVVSNIVSGGTQALAAACCSPTTRRSAPWSRIEAVNGASAAFTFPAGAGLLPQTVPARDLQPANALLRLATTARWSPAPRLGGILVAAVGPGWGLAADAVSFLVAAALLRRDPGRAGASGCRRATRHRRAARGLDGVPVPDLALGRRPRVRRHQRRARRRLVHASARPSPTPPSAGSGWGFVLGAETAGMFARPASCCCAVRFRRPLFVGMLGVLAWSPLMLVLAAEPRRPAARPRRLRRRRIGIELFGIGWDLSMQQHIPPHRLSRVYAYDALGSLVSIPIGQVLAGPLAAAVGVQEAVVLCGLAVMVAGGLAIAVPAVRRLERTDLPDAEARRPSRLGREPAYDLVVQVPVGRDRAAAGRAVGAGEVGEPAARPR